MGSMLGTEGIPKFQKHKVGSTTKYQSDEWRVGPKEGGSKGGSKGGRKNKRREEAIKIKNCKNFKGTPKQTAIPWRRTATSLAENQ